MFLLKQKLPVEVADINSIQINQVDVGEAGEHEVFEELAADASRPHHQDPAPGHGLSQFPGQTPRQCQGWTTTSRGGGGGGRSEPRPETGGGGAA